MQSYANLRVVKQFLLGPKISSFV